MVQQEGCWGLHLHQPCVDAFLDVRAASQLPSKFAFGLQGWSLMAKSRPAVIKNDHETVILIKYLDLPLCSKSQHHRSHHPQWLQSYFHSMNQHIQDHLPGQDQPPCPCPLLFTCVAFSFSCHRKSAPLLPGFHPCERYFKTV
jgi:hypothetical protein